MAIRTSNLSKVYQKGIRKKKVESLKDVNLEVREGEVFGFVGPNGAGKTTTIKIITGLLKPTRGTAWINGSPIGTPSSRKAIGYLPENPSFYGYLSVRDLLSLVADIRGVSNSKKKKKIAELICLVGLEEAGKRQIRTFSKGMIQRAGLAAALIGEPSLLILDEPMSGLDPFGRELVARLIRDLQAKGKTIFFSTHILPDIEALCDTVGILVKGELKYIGAVQDILFSKEKILELTVYLPLGIEIENISLKSAKVLWKKEGLYRLEVREDDIPRHISEVCQLGGSIIKIERKRKSFEELYKNLVLGDSQSVDRGILES